MRREQYDVILEGYKQHYRHQGSTTDKCTTLINMSHYLVLPFYPLLATKWLISSTPLQAAIVGGNTELCMKVPFQSLYIHAIVYVEH